MRAVEGALGDEKVYSISEITSLIKDLIESELPAVWVVGEISNYKVHSSGHTYFTLKDDNAQIRCVLFSGNARRLSFSFEDGLKVYARGRLSVYEKQGLYEIIVDTMMPLGKGELYLAFNKLKEKLAKEGVFDAERKKTLPRFPSKLAVVTSPTGAAVRDVIRVATGIHAGIEIVVYPVRVQGEGAAEEIAEAIAALNRIGQFDVIVLARGGGSLEDLWAFNEEVVARAISVSEIPIVSAVGHEIDFTIADFTADARAPTPSAAPTLVLADYVDVRAKLDSLMQKAGSAVLRRTQRYHDLLAGLRSHYGLRRIKDRLVGSMRDIDEAVARAERSIRVKVDSETAMIATLSAKIEALSPFATLDRGYSICFGERTGRVVRSYEEIKRGDRLRIRFATGGAIAEVERTGEEIT
jgi:exodeoxyribonuclease VII large subunit